MFAVSLILLLAAETCAQQPEDPLKLAIAEQQAGHIDKAIAAATEVINKDSDLVEAYLLRSSLRLTAGDAYGAMADLNKAIQLNPALDRAYYERALIRVLAKDVNGAVQDLDLAIATNHNNDRAYLLRGQLRSNLGALKSALSDYDQSIKLNPNNPQTYAARAGLLLTMEDRDRALLDLDYLLTWYETDPQKRGGSERTGDTQATSRDINIAPGDKEMLSTIAGAYFNRGSISSFRGNIDEAISDFTKSIRLDSTNVWAFYNRAREFEVRGDLDAALADVSRAIQIDPMNGSFRLEHGVVLVMMGKNKEAQVDFDMLLNTDRALWQQRIAERLATIKPKLPPNP